MMKVSDKLEARTATRVAELLAANSLLQAEIARLAGSDEKLRDNEEHYRNVAETAADAIIATEEDGTITFVNRAAERIFGYSSAELWRQKLTLLMPDYLRHVQQASLKTHTATGVRHLEYWECIEVAGLDKDGFEIPVELCLSRFTQNDQHVFTFVVRNIADRRQAEEELSRLAAIVETSEDAITSKSLDGIIITWNRGAHRVYGYSASEVIGKSVSILVPPDRMDELTSILEKVGRGEHIENLETVRVRKGGKRLEVSVTISPIHDSAGNVTGASTIARNITEKKLLEQQFLQAQRMEAVGQLAGGIAHDFNNLLTAIIGYSDLLKVKLGVDHPAIPYVEEIGKAGQRAAGLTRQILAFSRKQILELNVLDLNTIVASTSNMLKRLIGEDIELVALTKPDLGRVRADRGQIEQALLNLAVNARDAMVGGGKLTIESANVEIDDLYANSHPEYRPGRYVMLAVSDTGHGMDAQTAARMFEPFFTTKEQGRGTGLGLSTVYGIVKQLSGFIWADSEVGQGTSFKVYLPRVDEEVTALEPEVETVLSRGSETILLVEDEEIVRKLAQKVLEVNGYTVLEAANGREALQLIEEHSASIELMVTDVVMPGMSGKELSELLADKLPATKVLYLSGYTDDAIGHHGLLEKGTAFLQKPFSPDSLLRKVRKVLDVVGI